MNPRIRDLSPLIVTFVLVTVAALIAKLLDKSGKVDYTIVIGAGCLFFLVSLLIFRMQFLAMHNSNPNVFVRSVMMGTVIKILICLGAAVAYYFTSGPAFNKPAVYLGMIIYVIFLTVEVRTIMKLNKTKNG